MKFGKHLAKDKFLKNLMRHSSRNNFMIVVIAELFTLDIMTQLISDCSVCYTCALAILMSCSSFQHDLFGQCCLGVVTWVPVQVYLQQPQSVK